MSCMSARITYAHSRNTSFLQKHCNALQHTATHCNTLQHTATHCNTHAKHHSCTIYSLLWALTHIIMHSLHPHARHRVWQYRNKTYVYDVSRESAYSCIAMHVRSVYDVLLLYCHTARCRADETWNGHRNSKQNPRWWKLMSLFKWAVSKETCDDHRGFRFVFRWQFRVLSSREQAVCVREKGRDWERTVEIYHPPLPHTHTHTQEQIWRIRM